MRVLVTGCQGYIGTRMVPLLRRAGFSVTGLDSDLYRRCTFGTFKPCLEVLAKDVRDATVEDLAGIDAVIHLAGLSNDPLGDLNPELTYEINHRASVRLAETAKRAGVSRFVFSSSCSVYGASASEDFLDESSALNPVTPYGKSKLMGEEGISRLADEAFSPVLMRSATAYGVSPRLRFDLVLNNLVAYATATGRIFFKSDGTAWRPLVHIEDISRAFLAALTAPREAVHNQIFNVGRTSENFRIRDLAEIIAGVVPGCEVEFAGEASADKRNYRVDCSKAERGLPGYAPIWTAQRGAEELYDAYCHIETTVNEFEGDRYGRVAHLKSLLGSGALAPGLRWEASAGVVA